MVQITGKYQLRENKNYYELLVALGLPQDLAKIRNEGKPIVEVEVDGKNIKYTTDAPPSTSNLVVGEEVEEKVAENKVVLSSTQLEGNVLTVTSKTKDGKPAGVRTTTFSDKGIETVLDMSRDGKSVTAIRYFDRI